MVDSQNSSHFSDPVGTVTHACNPSKDVSSPYYLHHSGNHSSVIFTPELTLANSWRRSFLLAVSIRNKQGFLDGSIPKPIPEDPLDLSWVRCNNLLVAWLLRSVSPPIASTMFYMEDAKQIWEKLNQGFFHHDDSRIFHLQQLLCTVTQGTKTVDDQICIQSRVTSLVFCILVGPIYRLVF
ncbi:hypothetical protein P3X46_009492 [Hevea brasiliensis]|uniref:Retrotransposon Copia-like N-terminal domain-containing protein n=1 Tax=Hevea brasiliensis TaxID=3981 RepID=A0ABQ9MM09_HEVBR|nr:hypothetical protein P3X46_009492 [Hevea brasiliensis]